MQGFLNPHRLLSLLQSFAVPAAVRLHFKGLDVIRKVHAKKIIQKLPILLIQNRKQQLYPPLKIAGHPVSAGKIPFRITAVFKIEYPAVLQIAVDNTDDADVFADTPLPGNEHTDPPHV